MEAHKKSLQSTPYSYTEPKQSKTHTEIALQNHHIRRVPGKFQLLQSATFSLLIPKRLLTHNSSPDFPNDFLNNSILSLNGITMLDIISVPPYIINHSSKAEFTKRSL
jgi:hypothetical protein